MAELVRIIDKDDNVGIRPLQSVRLMFQSAYGYSEGNQLIRQLQRVSELTVDDHRYSIINEDELEEVKQTVFSKIKSYFTGG